VNGVTINDDERWCSGFETLKVCTEYNYKGKKHCIYNYRSQENELSLPRI
jgi:hypothetical protein